MANIKSNLCQTSAGHRPAVIPSQAGEVIARRGVAAIPATLAASDIIELVPLPAGCVIVDAILDATDLDTHGTPTLTLTAGLVNSGGTDLTATTQLLTASTIGQTGGMARMAVNEGLKVASDPDTQRNVGVKVANVGATPAAGTMGLTLLYRAAETGE